MVGRPSPRPLGGRAALPPGALGVLESGAARAPDSTMGPHGLEPRFPEPKPGVLPLDEGEVCEVVGPVGLEPTWGLPPRAPGARASALFRHGPVLYKVIAAVALTPLCDRPNGCFFILTECDPSG